MGQKVNPTGFRLGITTDHRSRWFADSTKPGQRYRDFVKEDVQIRRLMEDGMERAGISKVDIERRPATVCAWTSTPPARASSSAAAAPRPSACAAPWRSSPASRSSSTSLRSRTPTWTPSWSPRGSLSSSPPRRLRRAMRKGMQSAVRAGAKGIRVQCSGRLGGAEMSRSEFYREGRVPLHTLRANIDYGFYEADHLRTSRRQGVDLQGRPDRARVRSPAGASPARVVVAAVVTAVAANAALSARRVRTPSSRPSRRRPPRTLPLPRDRRPEPHAHPPPDEVPQAAPPAPFGPVQGRQQPHRLR